MKIKKVCPSTYLSQILMIVDVHLCQILMIVDVHLCQILMILVDVLNYIAKRKM
jgi:hypothetical protein